MSSQYNTYRNSEDRHGQGQHQSRQFMSHSVTQRILRQGQLQNSPVQIYSSQPTEINNLTVDPPMQYDIEFYQRKVNRLQNDMCILQDQLSLAKFRLSKAEDYQRKYDMAFQQNQNLVSQLEMKEHENAQLSREIQELIRKNDQDKNYIQILEDKVQNQKRNNIQTKEKYEKITSKLSNQGKDQKASTQDHYLGEITNLKEDFRSKQQHLKRKIVSLEKEIESQSLHEKALKFKFESMSKEKNNEIQRLNQLTNSLKEQFSAVNNSTDERVVNMRTDLITQTERRLQNVRLLANDIQESLMSQIRSLNFTIAQKNSQIEFIVQADKQFMQDNEITQNSLRAHITRLQDRIFVIQRQNQIELFETIDRLQKQYQENINSLNDEFDNIRKTHMEEVDQLNEKISHLEKQNKILTRENIRVEEEHKKIASDKEEAIKMLSQKIISLQSSKDIDLKQYTTSMKEIQMDAKAKLEDLHSAIQTKNTEFQILNAQLNLKNQQITSLIQEIFKLRNQNREKMKNLELKNDNQQNTLNKAIFTVKKQIQELRRRINELQEQISDKQAQFQLESNKLRIDLQSQKSANQLLKSRYRFLSEWCQQLERDLKAERVSNVNILHDTNISRRETVQIREQVKVQLEAIKDKEVQQIRNIFKLEKNRIEADLLNKEHQLREKKQELARLLVQYKKLQVKVGKPSKFERGAEEAGKCKATLNAEILLTQNILEKIEN